MKKGFPRMRTREIISGYAFALPWLAGLLLFTLIPFGYSVWMSLSSVRLPPGGGIVTEFAGLRWYREALTADVTFLPALLDTVKFVVLSTPMIVVAALLLSLMLSRGFTGRAFFRTLFFFPVVIISGPVISELINTKAAAVIAPEQFVIYDFIASLPAMIAVPLLYIFDNIVLIFWFSGVQIILFLAGIQKIGRPLIEAASIDGASGWQIFWKITLPFLKPLILLNTIYTVVLLSGFSGNAINIKIMEDRDAVGKVYAYSSAMAWMYFIIILILLCFVYLLLRNRKDRKLKQKP